MNEVEYVVARFEANPGVFGALSCSEQIAIALIYDRPELLQEPYKTRKAAVMRLGKDWHGKVAAIKAAGTANWGNKTEIIEGVQLCQRRGWILTAIDALFSLCLNCHAANVAFTAGKMDEDLRIERFAVEKKIRILKKQHMAGDCTCSFCKRVEELGLWV